MEEIRRQIFIALWDEHFADDKISGVTKAECGLLAEQVLERLERAGIVQRRRAG